MIRFRQWLVLEDIARDSEAHGDVMYPSIAGDYQYAVSDPTEFWWLQWRWKMDKKLGRKFYNIDQPEFEKRQYVSLQSTDMPGAGDGFWEHRPNNKPTQTVHKHKHLHFIKIGKNSKTHKLMPNKGYYSIDSGLERTFGDNHSGKLPQEADNTDWTKWKRPK